MYLGQKAIGGRDKVCESPGKGPAEGGSGSEAKIGLTINNLQNRLTVCQLALNGTWFVYPFLPLN